jgi:nitrogen fixation protein NifB
MRRDPDKGASPEKHHRDTREDKGASFSPLAIRRRPVQAGRNRNLKDVFESGDLSSLPEGRVKACDTGTVRESGYESVSESVKGSVPANVFGSVPETGSADPAREELLGSVCGKNRKDVENHPCFSTRCQPMTGRIHLPVAPRCNIFCRFCSRGLSKGAELPGNAMRILSPSEAADVVDTALLLCPDIKVAGVAGPGDPLAGPESLEALTLVKRAHKDIISCLSTNGLELYANMDGLLAADVRTLTVTVNAVDPEVLLKLNRGVLVDGRFIGGTDGAKTLIAAQEKGVREAARNSMTVKVNMVLVPGINGDRAGETARTVKEWGADIVNIIPLIPAHDLKDSPAPTAEEYARASDEAGRYLPVKTNCRRCRADACGIPGLSDYSERIYGAQGVQETFSHG